MYVFNMYICIYIHTYVCVCVCDYITHIALKKSAFHQG